MAIGDGYSNNENGNNRTLYDQTYYSRFSIRNDNKQLSLWFRSGLMVLELNEIDKITYKRTPIGNIYLSPTKAQMFVGEINKFREYRNSDKIKENVAFGVTGGMKEKVSYVGLHTNKDKDIFLTIGKFDENGKIVEANTIKFNKDYNYSIEWEDISKMKLERVFDNDIELNMLQSAIAEFAKNMSGSAGYAAADLTRYDHARIMRKMDPIYDKLGIDRRSYGNNGSRNFGNDFLSNTNTSSKSTTIEEVANLLEDDDY
jgi:hypothetical protein